MNRSASSLFRTVAVLLFGLIAYSAAGVVVPAHLLFVGDVIHRWQMDQPQRWIWWHAALWDSALLLLFFCQHSLMARSWFKRITAVFATHGLERSLYVFFASLLLAVQFVLWEPIGPTVWYVECRPLRQFLFLGYIVGWILVYWATFALNHFDLLGLRQAFCSAMQRPYVKLALVSCPPYRWLRHPLMIGLLLVYWSAPRMTVGHLGFALLSTIYIYIGTRLESSDLARRSPVR